MTAKPGLWRSIALALTGINVAGLGYAAALGEPWHAATHAALTLVFGWWAHRLWQGPGGSEFARVKQELEQQAGALEEARNALASQSAELMELQERVDFAERLLTQMRDRPALGGRDERV
jgi:hypothetical protein